MSYHVRDDMLSWSPCQLMPSNGFIIKYYFDAHNFIGSGLLIQLPGFYDCFVLNDF